MKKRCAMQPKGEYTPRSVKGRHNRSAKKGSLHAQAAFFMVEPRSARRG